MDYEKKYNEALERAREYLNPVYPTADKTLVQEIFPELRESEDERIRKAVVSLVYEMKGTYQSFAKVELDQMVAWLEKQKEQKSAWMEKALEGEVMTNGFYPYEPRIVAPYPNCPYDFGDKVCVVVLPKED